MIPESGNNATARWHLVFFLIGTPSRTQIHPRNKHCAKAAISARLATEHAIQNQSSQRSESIGATVCVVLPMMNNVSVEQRILI
jgi:hypothetical protein